jgi:diguanylate cyclase (GGDEF)-like protein
MRLLAPQQIRELLQIAEDTGFKKEDFRLDERQSRLGRGKRVHVLAYMDTAYYFAFEYAFIPRPRPGVLLPCVEFSPGTDRLIKLSPPTLDWQAQVSQFHEWLGILKNEIMQASSGPVQIDFTEQQRIQIYYLVRDVLALDNGSWLDMLESPEETFGELEEALKRQLSRLSIGDGTPHDVIKSFLLTASYDDVLTLLQLLPLIPLLIARKYKPPRAGSDWGRGLEFLAETIPPAINSVLETTASPARYNESGEFHKDGFSITTPQELLKLPNREALFRDLRAQLRGPRPVAAVFIDLDGFKQVNDTLGHAEGNKCLERVAEILGAVVSARGKLYRYAGDEFAVVLPNTVDSEAAATGERLRSALEEGNVGGAARVTASIGIITSDRLKTQEAEEFVEAADKAMYASKHSGKNRVTLGPVTN